MKKIILAFITISTLVFVACEEKSTTTPSSSTSTTTTTGATYYISANIDGVDKVFTNLTVYRDELSNPDNPNLSIVANNTSSSNPKFEIKFSKPDIGWSNSLEYALTLNDIYSYVKYTNSKNQVYESTIIDQQTNSFNIKFSEFNYAKDAIIIGTFNGNLPIGTDTSEIRFVNGKIKLKIDN